MLFYYFLSISCLFLSLSDFPIIQNLYYQKQSVINQKRILYLIGLSFIILGGIRWVTGTDWPAYYNFFNDNTNWTSFKSNRFELGYTFINWIVKCFTKQYTIFLLIFHFLVIYPKLKIIHKVSVYPLLTLFLYSCTYTGEIFAVRNQLGVTLLICSIPAMEKQNKKQFLFLTILATSIHYSCFAWIISYYIYNKSFKKITWVVLYSLALIFLLIGKDIYPKLVIKLFSPFSSYGIIFEKILLYSSPEYQDTANNIFSLVLSLLKRVLFLPFYFLYYDKLVQKNKYNKGLLNLYLFGNAFQLFFFSSFQQMGRLIIANIFLEIFILPQLVLLPKKKDIKMLLLYLFFAYGMLKVTHLLPFREVLIPYYTFFHYYPRTLF